MTDHGITHKNCLILIFALFHNTEHGFVLLTIFHTYWCVLYRKWLFYQLKKSRVPTVIHLLKAISQWKPNPLLSALLHLSLLQQIIPIHLLGVLLSDRKLIMRPTSCLMNSQTHKHTHALEASKGQNPDCSPRARHINARYTAHTLHCDEAFICNRKARGGGPVGPHGLTHGDIRQGKTADICTQKERKRQRKTDCALHNNTSNCE